MKINKRVVVPKMCAIVSNMPNAPTGLIFNAQFILALVAMFFYMSI